MYITNVYLCVCMFSSMVLHVVISVFTEGRVLFIRCGNKYVYVCNVLGLNILGLNIQLGLLGLLGLLRFSCIIFNTFPSNC